MSMTVTWVHAVQVSSFSRFVFKSRHLKEKQLYSNSNKAISGIGVSQTKTSSSCFAKDKILKTLECDKYALVTNLRFFKSLL